MTIWERQARRLRREAYVYYYVFKHSRVRWPARIVAACTAAYLLSPIQFIPSFIPFVGLLDDALVLFLGVKLLQRMIPADVLAECRQRAEGKQKVRSAAAVVGSVAIVSLWLLAAVTASVLVMRYARR
jgi:uncharacterized membrane protein YkvA (DUF1232 family)